MRFDELPAALKSVRTRSLFMLRLEVRTVLVVGGTPNAYRRVGLVSGGAFEGERLSGSVLDGGSDWLTLRSDGSTTLDVRLVLRTTDDALICMTYRGIRHGPSDVLERIDRGEPVDPATYYFRTTSSFETSVAKYDWINRIVAIGIGQRNPAPAPPLQHDQLLSEHRVFSLEPRLRSERRDQDGQNEAEEPDHPTSLSDSLSSSME